MLPQAGFSPLARVLIVAAAACVVAAFMRWAAPILAPILLALFITIVATPPLQWMRRKGLPKYLAVLIILLVLLDVGSLIALTTTGALEAFYLDMQDQMDNLLLVVQSEFGRKVPENASAGTDHGAGNVMILMGGGLAGGKVHTKWPTLAPEKWDDRALAVTIDYRDVMSELLSKRLGNKNITEIFPNYKPAEHGLVVEEA